MSEIRLGDFIRRPDCSFVQRILIINLHSFASPVKETARKEASMVLVEMVRLVQVLIAVEFVLISPVMTSQWL